MAVTLFPKKITTQTMGLKPAELETIAQERSGTQVPVLRVWGIVSGAKGGVSQFGNFIAFSGEFGALNLITGDEARSQTLLLPSVAEGVVASLFVKASKDGGSAQIGIEVAVEENLSAKGGTKFRYIVKPLFEYKGDDAMAELAKQLPTPVFVNDKPVVASKATKK